VASELVVQVNELQRQVIHAKKQVLNNLGYLRSLEQGRLVFTPLTKVQKRHLSRGLSTINQSEAILRTKKDTLLEQLSGLHEFIAEQRQRIQRTESRDHSGHSAQRGPVPVLAPAPAPALLLL
tara:strand:- start:131 stop:499 length:369 start_codon:yes stop_codon:yes gene_type:complete